MTDNEYLKKVLENQTLTRQSDEAKHMQERREEIEGVVRDAIRGRPTFRYGGSYAKRTMVRSNYDLDLLCYFDRDDDGPGETLKEIYEAVESALKGTYMVQRKRCAIRVFAMDAKSPHRDFHIDVVPGRYDDDAHADVWLHVTAGDKDRLKTNPDKQIEHITKSGRRGEIKLAKTWAHMTGLTVQTFVLELLVIKALKSHDGDLAGEMETFWNYLRDHENDLRVEDPANPDGNDLSDLLNLGVRSSLACAARTALEHVENDDWQSIFGALPKDDGDRKVRIAAAVAASPSRPKPWADTE